MKRLLLIGLLFSGVFSLLTGCSKANDYYNEGKKYFASGNYEEAAGQFAMALGINKNRADYFIDYGMSLIGVGKYEEAIEQFDQAYQEKNMKIILENNKRALRGKGITYYYMKDYEEATRQFDLALQIEELSDLNLDILYYKGCTLLKLGKYDEAEKAFTSILSIDENNAKAYYQRAYVYKLLGDYESSLSDYDMAISMDPNCFDYYFDKYNLYLGIGKTEEANQVLAEAEKIEIVTNEDKYNLAKLHFYQKQYEVALYELGESSAKNFSEAYYYIGEIKREQKNYRDAIYQYKLYIDSKKVLNPNVYNQIAVCHMRLGEYKDALAYLQWSMNYPSGSLRVLKKNEIIAHEKLGDFDTALEKIQEYINLYPEDQEALREWEFIKTRIKKPKSE